MKTKHLNTILLLAACISIALLPSCRFRCVKGSGHQTSETRKTEDFTKIEIDGGFKVNIKQDSSLSFTINADDNLMQYIKSSVSGGKLHIYSKKKMCPSGEMVINIGVKNLDAIKISGAVDLTTDGKLTTKDIRLDINGAGKVTMDLNADNVLTEGAGNVEMNMKGQATSHKVEIAGSAKVNALDFVVGSYDIETTGASDCQINVLKDLSVNTTGAADIKYRGNPTSVNTSKTGAATVTKIN